MKTGKKICVWVFNGAKMVLDEAMVTISIGGYKLKDSRTVRRAADGLSRQEMGAT